MEQELITNYRNQIISFEIDMVPFDKASFINDIIDMTSAFFLGGISLNNVTYTLDDEMSVKVNCEEHYPAKYSTSVMYRWIGLMLRDVPETDFPLDNQVRMIDAITDTFYYNVPFKSALFCSSSKVKRGNYYHVIKEELGISPETMPLDAVELQGNENQIITAKIIAAPEVRGDGDIVVVDDLSMGFHCLRGRPGPYVKDFMNNMSTKDISAMVTAMKDTRCTILLSQRCTYGAMGRWFRPRSQLRLSCRWRVSDEINLGFGDNLMCGKKRYREIEREMTSIAFFWMTRRLRVMYIQCGNINLYKWMQPNHTGSN